MSLLNDMLRDLSHHKPVTNNAENSDKDLLESSSFTKKQSQSWVSLIIFFVVIFLIVIAIKTFFFSSRPIPHQETVAVKATKINQTSTASLDTTSSSNEPVKEPDSEAATEAKTSVETQHHIDDLIAQAERAMNMDRLTSPVEDNAYGYYQKILTLDFANEAAKEGLDRIAARYMLKAQEQFAVENSQQAEALIRRARFVSERYVQAHEVVDENPPYVETNSVPASENERFAVEKASSESVKSFPVAEATHVSIIPNAAWQDEQLAQHGQQLIQQGKQAEATELLKNFVAKEQKPAQSAALLADLYIEQGNVQAAKIILQRATYLATDTSAKLLAQTLVAEGDDMQAIAVLEKNLQSADANEAYRSLLASLYHKTANYQQSITSYQRLLNSFGEKPAYWLGLALAYDGLSQPKSALQAYKRLREFPQLQDQVKKYTDNRISALSGE